MKKNKLNKWKTQVYNSLWAHGISFAQGPALLGAQVALLRSHITSFAAKCAVSFLLEAMR
jgi:hypothetical protein